MIEEIKKNLDNPRQLEKLYRENKSTFKEKFNLLFPEISDIPIAQIWNERLNFESAEISWGSKNELIFVIASSIIAGLLAKIPEFTKIEADFFYQRNIGFIIFPILTAYFTLKQTIHPKRILSVSLMILFSIIYINLLPNSSKSDTFVLACIHLPLFLWSVLGFAYVGDNVNDDNKRLDFLRYNGDLMVMTTIILIAGIILTAITLGLFGLIGLEIEEFYLQYVVIFGLAASPIVGTFLIQTNPQIVNRVSPVIAKVFTPIVLLTLVIYLVAIIRTGKDPYNDREFLLIFNMLLVGVIAITLFSIVETPKDSKNKIGTCLLLGLAFVTVIVNGIALSAILFRLAEWGITPNRIAVLGGNMIILTNLLIVTYGLFRTIIDSNEKVNVEKSIAKFLPIYSIWTIIVTFVFPIVFNFK